MSEVSNLSASVRDRTGTGGARADRRAGLIPAVIYGAGKDNALIALDRKTLVMEVQRPGFLSRMFDIDVGGQMERVLPRDVQRHPVTDLPLHVDFMRISAATEVTVMVPVHFAKEEASPGLKRGGVLNIVRHEVEVDCRADAIPESFTIDLTGTDIGDSIHASRIALPEGVSFTITDRDFTIATIAAPTVMRSQAEGGEGEGEGEGEGD